EALAAVLASQGVQNEVPPSTAPAGRPRVLARNTDGERPPLVFVHGDFNGAGFYCLSLAAQLGAAQPFHGLMPHGIDGGAIPASRSGEGRATGPIAGALEQWPSGCARAPSALLPTLARCARTNPAAMTGASSFSGRKSREAGMATTQRRDGVRWLRPWRSAPF